MQEAVRLAQQCEPKETRIPKVGAVIALRGMIIGCGQRGTGEDGDDDHAEYRALGSIVDPSQLPEATFMTLEPCTTDVRSRAENCRSELILQRKIKKVFIGILDPNQRRDWQRTVETPRPERRGRIVSARSSSTNTVRQCGFH